MNQPNFRLERPDIRDRLITALLMIAFVLLMIDGWLEFVTS
jgi:hypothetical protein